MTAIEQVTSELEPLCSIVPRAVGAAAVWLDDVVKLYLLAFLLTADKVLAEQCFSDAMDNYVGSTGDAATEWATEPGRIAVIRRAVRLIRPLSKSVYSWSHVLGCRPLLSPVHRPFSVITSFNAFERFVFVLSVLEGYSVQECAELLECEPGDIECSEDLATRLLSTIEAETESWHDCDSLLATQR
jgi:hypothetical protein